MLVVNMNGKNGWGEWTLIFMGIQLSFESRSNWKDFCTINVVVFYNQNQQMDLISVTNKGESGMLERSLIRNDLEISHASLCCHKNAE